MCLNTSLKEDFTLNWPKNPQKTYITLVLLRELRCDGIAVSKSCGEWLPQRVGVVVCESRSLWEKSFKGVAWCGVQGVEVAVSGG